MNNRNCAGRRQRGALLIAALMLIVTVTGMIVAMSYISTADIRSGSGSANADQAQFAAAAGIEYAKGQFLTGTKACDSALDITAPVGNASFTITGSTQYAHTSGSSINTPTTTNGAVTLNATSIAVTNATGYAPFGRIVIDEEEIYYNSVSGNTLQNVVRGYGNTQAATHLTNTPVLQGLCNIQATGTMGSTTRSLTANMPVQLYKAGVITKKTTAGTGNVSYTGVGFRPNVLIFYWTEQTVSGAVTANGVGASAGVGFATSSTQQYVASTGMRDNNTNTGNVRRSSASNVIIFHTVTVAAPTLLAQASLVTMDNDGFTLNWTTNVNTNGYLINYIALGGDTTGFVGTFTMNAAVTASQSVSGSGFKPQFLMFAHAGENAADAQTLDGQFGIGFAESSSSQGALVSAGETVLGTSSSRWQQLTNRAILFLTHAAPPLASGQGSLSTMDSNGFTIAVNTAGLANQVVGYLALRGARADTGNFNEPGATGAQTPVSTLDYTPNGVMLASRSLTTAATLGTGRTAIGAGGGSPVVDGNIWFQEQDNAGTANANSYIDATNVISMGANNATTNTAQASLTSLNFGGFTLNWGARNSTREILYWAVGPRNYTDVKEMSH